MRFIQAMFSAHNFDIPQLFNFSQTNFFGISFKFAVSPKLKHFRNILIKNRTPFKMPFIYNPDPKLKMFRVPRITAGISPRRQKIVQLVAKKCC
jgi:hypothetical protein